MKSQTLGNRRAVYLAALAVGVVVTGLAIASFRRDVEGHATKSAAKPGAKVIDLGESLEPVRG